MSQKKRLSRVPPRATHAYLDVTCNLMRAGETFRVVLAFRDWAGGGQLLMHEDFSTEDQALDSIANVIELFDLRRMPRRDQWRNAASPGFQRAIWRVAGRQRRSQHKTQGKFEKALS